MHASSTQRRYFVPQDWILEHEDQLLVVTRLGTGEVVRITGSAASDTVERRMHPSIRKIMTQHEPVLRALFDQIGAHDLAPLNRASVLRGAGWRQLFIELTARCNERCVHCYAGSSPERTESLSLDEIKSALDDAKTLMFDAVQFTGGDPLVSKHCIAAVEYARSIGIERLEVYTNGLALRGETYERLRELDVAFAFSFYSHDATRHDAITQTKGSHARTSRAIRRAAEDGLRVRTGTIMMNENRGDAPETHDYLVQLGVKAEAVGFDQSREVGRGTTPDDAALGGRSDHAHGGAPSRPFGGSAAVGYDGQVFPCIFSRDLPLGSIRETSLADILNAPVDVGAVPEELLRERERLGDKLSCWECQTRSILIGGPRAQP